MKRLHDCGGTTDYVARDQREGVDAQGRVASEFGYQGASKELSEQINLGLALLSVLRKPGVPLALDDIAAWCGCSSSAILLIEQKALRKLSHRLRFMKETDPRLGEMVDDLFYAREVAQRKEVA